MSMLVAWVLYPVVLLGLCAGLGLLVDSLSGRRLPGALLAPVGLAAMVVVGQFTTLADATAELTAPLLVLLAIVGGALSIPWRFARPDRFLVLTAVAVFAVFGAPVVLSGDPTFAGYIKLDDTATWFALTDRIMEHGRSLDGLAPSTYQATLDFNLADGYPIGAFVPFGTVQKMVGEDLAWVFQPYLASLAAMLALALWQVLGSVVERRGLLRALAVFIAAQPALLFGYAMWGGVKEMGAAALIALAAALAPAALDATSTPRQILPLALAAGALVGVLSLGGMIWLAPMLAVLAIVVARRFGVGAAAVRSVAFLVPFVVCVLPVVAGGLLPPTSEPLTDPDAEGNLRGPLHAAQALGIWPSGDFRFDPDATVATAVLIALALLCAGVALWVVLRGRRTTLLLYASTAIGGAAIFLIGSPWAGGKALATVSPVILALAIVGALAILRVDRPTGIALVIVVSGGVLWSNVLAYGGVSLAPYDQLAELERIGERHAGKGPALMTEYNPYGARHFLRALDAEGASELRFRQVPLVAGGTPEKGEWIDTEQIEETALYEYRTLVLRRSPLRSRPPSVYRLVSSGDYYEVWQRPQALEGLPPERLFLGDTLDPAAVPVCSEVGGLGLLALTNGLRDVRLLGAPREALLDATDGSLTVPRDDVYVAWLKGSVRGSVELYVDGRRVGEARHQLNNEGGFVELGELRLSQGQHRVELRFGGADLHPGSGGFPRLETGPLLFVSASDEVKEVGAVDVAESERLCGKRWDWIEAVEGPATS